MVCSYFILKKVFKFDALCYKRYATINVNRPASLGGYHWWWIIKHRGYHSPGKVRVSVLKWFVRS